jgi:hypothetical protein
MTVQPTSLTELIEFVRLVRAMREAQRAYSKTRDQSKLVAAKQLEAKIDTALGRFI